VFWYPNPYSSFSLWLEDAILTSYLARHTRLIRKNFSNRRKKPLLGKGTEVENKKRREKKEKWAWEELQINLVSFAKNHALGERKKKMKKTWFTFWSTNFGPLEIGSFCSSSSSFLSLAVTAIHWHSSPRVHDDNIIGIARRLSPSPFFSPSREFRNSDFWVNLTWTSQFAIVDDKIRENRTKGQCKKTLPYQNKFLAYKMIELSFNIK